jgi:hypothetical protein
VCFGSEREGMPNCERGWKTLVHLTHQSSGPTVPASSRWHLGSHPMRTRREHRAMAQRSTSTRRTVCGERSRPRSGRWRACELRDVQKH